MKKIFIIGAGRSSKSLIDYLDTYANSYNWKIVVGDSDINLAKEKITGCKNAEAIAFNVFDEIKLKHQVESADIVVSLLPAHLHHYVANECVHYGKNLVTASYVSEQVEQLNEQANQRDVLILMECGLDPGIDHMSAMRDIDDIKNQGGEITAFRSYTGGLVAPESDNNPWGYKFTWNPRGVVMAGKGTVKFIRNGKYKYIPYNSVFTRLDEVFVDGYGHFEAYANRNSLSYREVYGLQGIPTIIRGTLRKKGFCEAWNVFVRLGLTKDNFVVEGFDGMTYRDFLNSFLAYHPTLRLEEKLAAYLNIEVKHPIMRKIEWLGLFDETLIPNPNLPPADILLELLKVKWKLSEMDKDMVVMQHIFEYKLNDQLFTKKSTMVLKGENAENTSMARTVGLPLGIAAKLILNGEYKAKGVKVPTDKKLYSLILKELKNDFGIEFF